MGISPRRRHDGPLSEGFTEDQFRPDASDRYYSSARDLLHDHHDVQDFAWYHTAAAASQTAQSVATPELRVVVVSSNEIYVDKTKTNLAGLEPILRKRVSGSDAKQIRAVLEGQAGAEYQLIISVLDALRLNGIENVGLITRKDKVVQ